MTTRSSWTVEQMEGTPLPSYRATCERCEWTRTYATMVAARRQVSAHWRTHHAHEYFEWRARLRAEGK